MGLAELSDVLWRERELLEVLLFKLEEEQLLLVSGKTRWLARATREVEVVVDELRAAELRRAVVVDATAETLGLPVEPTLSQLAAMAPAPWDDLLREHRTSFLGLTREVQMLADGNRTLLAGGFRASREALLALGHGVAREQEPGYGRDGRAPAGAGSSLLVDQAF
jgi:hypothetical protein